MKKTLLLLSILLAVFSMNAQQVLGGDITWTCLTSGSDAGKYVFQLTLFNQCDSGSLSTSNQTITVHNGPISSIPVSFVKEENISLACYDTAQVVNCNRTGTGAVSMGVYKSSPVTLSGIPGAGGWKFTWTHCCRPAHTNVSGTPGYTLRSVMYNFQNQNMDPCFDNSPQFLAPPMSKLCVGYPEILNHYVNDSDPDLVQQTFAEPWSNSTTWPGSPVSFNAGYSFSSPFPGLSHDSLNVPAFLENPTGDIKYTSYTTNKIQHTVKVSSTRDNILISEVYRDFTIELINCPPTSTIPPLANVAPYVTFRDSANSPSIKPFPVVDTIWAGSPVKVNINSTDIQFLPGFIGQTNYMRAFGGQLGTGYISTSSGCDQPPCATLDTGTFYNPVNKYWEGTFGLHTDLTWNTDSSHGIQAGKAYNFYFQTNDDWCPTPGVSVHTYSVVVYETPSNWIAGKVFEDLNGNGTQDMGEPNVPNILVRQLPSHFYYNTDAAGEYYLGAYTGSHDISIRLPKYHTLTTPSAGKHTIVTSGSNNIYSGNDFGIQIIPNINDLRVDLTAISTNRPGFSLVYQMDYDNIGTSTLSGNVSLQIDTSILSFTTANPSPTTSVGGYYVWTFSNLAKNTGGSISANFVIDSSASSGDSIMAFTSINPITGDTIPSDNIDSLLKIVVNSWDPNNKESYPRDVVYESNIRNSEFIEYTLNFQNTGSASAIDVRIEDWIPEKLDIETFEQLGSSHSMYYEIRGRKITWFFDNINLPDSSTNFDASMGFVKFRIKADPTLPLGDTIYNSINIFFDLNEPVYAENKIAIVEDLPVIIPGINDPLTQVDPVVIFPNPSEDLFNLRIQSEKQETLQYGIFTISGNQIDAGYLNADSDGLVSAEIDLSQQKRGIYLIRIQGEEINVVKKLVLK